MTPDPYEPYLKQADDLFAQGEVLKAGQIWQAILKQQPSHAEAHQRLLIVKEWLLARRSAASTAQAPSAPAQAATEAPAATAPAAPPVPAPIPAPPSSLPSRPSVQAESPGLDTERLLAQGCTLYDMGQVEDALRKWEQVLAQEPAHSLARNYANSARRELGLPSLSAPAAPAPMEAHDLDEDIPKLLREASQLYDLGLVEEAIHKWERVHAREPQHPEVDVYLRQARAELKQKSNPLPPPPTPVPISAVDAVDVKLRHAEHLLSMQRFTEAAFTFQQILALSPGHALALRGLERCRKPEGGAAPTSRPALDLDAQGRIAMDVQEPSPEPEAVQPPAALLKAVPPPRKGLLPLPDQLKDVTNRLSWLRAPRTLAVFGGGGLALLLGLTLIHGYRKDQRLKEEIRSARAAAAAPLAEQAQAPDLEETPASILDEAREALGQDPLRAFLRAETVTLRNPGNPAGAQLLEKAREELPGGMSGVSMAEFQKHLQAGDLSLAGKVIDTLLRAQPNDGELRKRAARLHLALCVAHAGQGKWEEAREDLMRGRALFPEDKTWQARLRLLERVQNLPKKERAGWISLLG